MKTDPNLHPVRLKLIRRRKKTLKKTTMMTGETY